jgi:hypothetical protein
MKKDPAKKSSRGDDRKLQVLTAQALDYDKRSRAAEEQARLAKDRFKAAKKTLKVARNIYKATKKAARKAQKQAEKARCALQLRLGKVAAKKKRASGNSFASLGKNSLPPARPGSSVAANQNGPGASQLRRTAKK